MSDAASGVEALAATVRRGLDRLERLARDADHNQPWTMTTGWDGPRVRVNNTLDGEWQRDGIGVSGAYTCDDPYDDCRDARASYEAEAQLIVQLADPARVLAEVAAKRALVDALLAEEHDAGDRFYYDERCPARDGKACDCGRDERVAAYLAILARPYQQETT